MARTVAITGAAGNLGRVLVSRLLAERDADAIVALDLVPPLSGDPRVEFRRVDVRDPDFGRHLAGCGALVHLAFIVESGSRDAALVEAVNVGGTQNVVAAAHRAGIRQVVYASSIAAYGFHAENARGPLREDAPIRGNPEFYYTRTKADVERWLLGFEAAHPEMAIARMRPTFFAGPRTTRAFLWAALASPAHLGFPGRKLPVHATHEDDVALAFALALRHRARGAWNVAAEEPLPARAWARALGKRYLALPAGLLDLLDSGYRLGLGRVDPAWMRFASRYPIVVSSEKLRRELGFAPRYPTTASVLGALAADPAAGASPATRLLLGSAAAITSLRGGVPMSESERYEMRTLRGTVNLALTGEQPSEWHVSFRDGAVGVHAGADPGASATTTLSERTLYDMLAGKTSYTAAQMTGKVRFRGPGELVFVVGAFVEAFKLALAAPGLRGWPRRAFARAVLRRAGVTAP